MENLIREVNETITELKSNQDYLKNKNTLFEKLTQIKKAIKANDANIKIAINDADISSSKKVADIYLKSSNELHRFTIHKLWLALQENNGDNFDAAVEGSEYGYTAPYDFFVKREGRGKGKSRKGKSRRVKRGGKGKTRSKSRTRRR